MTKAQLHGNWFLVKQMVNIYSDDSTVSGVILTEPGVNVQAQVDVAINQVVSEPREVEADEALNDQ